ncbi:MAG: hypothetical protein ACP5OG_05975 [Candidatus Nanoarchaeia archaeon]
MICRVCGNRFAPHPKEDFVVTSTLITPKNPESAKKRWQVYNNDESGVCSQWCKEKEEEQKQK